MVSEDMSVDTPICGICGRPLDGTHGLGSHGDVAKAGKRVEYIIVGKRGGIAEFRESDGGTKVRKTSADVLAMQLGVEESSLLGRHFSCWVEPAEYGVFRSDFKLVVQ